MALAFLHGSLSAIDVTAATASLKAAFGRVVAQIVRGSTRRTTFADGGWVNEQPGDKQCLFTLDGYSTKGTVWSDILYFITMAATFALVVTCDTGCTITADVNCFGDGIELVASANAGRSLTLRSAGVVSTSWITS